MQNIVPFLEANVALFHLFPQDKLVKIAALAEEGFFPAGASLIESGKEGTRLGVMLSGNAEALVRNEDHEKLRVGMLSPGDIFGEMSLLTSEKTTADVIGLSPCTVLWIGQDVFYSQVISHPPAMKYLCKILMERTKMIALEQTQNRKTVSGSKRTEGLLLAHANQQMRKTPIPLEVSAHHIHLSQEDTEKLFGKGHSLTRESDLSQPGQFACKEKVNLVGTKGRVENVRILGPVRKASQVEIAMTEQYKLGIRPPIRESGDIQGSPGIILEGPAGTATLSQGVICALRHIHMTPADATRLGLQDKAVVRVRVDGDRELIFGDVVVRVNPAFKLAMHIDTDEANAANIKTGAIGHIEGIQDHT